MIKVLSPAQRHLSNRTLEAFQNYWGESHGPLFANTKLLRRYVQHLTLPESYGGAPAPTFDGVSMFWYDDVEARRNLSQAPEVVALGNAVRADDAQLFDRTTTWPMHKKRASVIAEEKVIIEGTTTPEMVKGIFIATKLPGLSYNEFYDHWENHHGKLALEVAGIRRYVQNHAVPEAYLLGTQTHDGWSEIWFDDLAALQAAVASPEWKPLTDDGATLFAQPMGIGIAREKIQKDLDWTYNDWGVGGLSQAEIHDRLRDEGYASLASDPSAPDKLKAAAANKALAVWTKEHLVTIDASGIDVRPDR